MDEIIRLGDECVNKHKLGCAEKYYLDVIRQCESSDICNQESIQFEIIALMKLAFVYARLARSSTCTTIESFFHQLHALSILQNIFDLQDHRQDLKIDKDRSFKLLCELQDNLCQNLEDIFFNDDDDDDRHHDFFREWLDTIIDYVRFRSEKPNIIEEESEIIVDVSPNVYASHKEEEISGVSPLPVDVDQPVADRYVKVDKVQTAIKALVNEIILGQQRKRYLKYLHTKFGRRNERLLLCNSLPDFSEIPEICEILKMAEEDYEFDENELQNYNMEEKKMQPYLTIEIDLETDIKEIVDTDEMQNIPNVIEKMIEIDSFAYDENIVEEEEFYQEVVVEWKFVQGHSGVQVPIQPSWTDEEKSNRSKQLKQQRKETVDKRIVLIRIYPAITNQLPVVNNKSSLKNNTWTYCHLTEFQPINALMELKHVINVPDPYQLSSTRNLPLSSDAILLCLLKIIYKVSKSLYDKQNLDDCRQLIEMQLILLNNLNEKQQDSRILANILELLARMDCNYEKFFERGIGLFEESLKILNHLQANNNQVGLQILQCIVFIADSYLSVYTVDGKYFNNLLLIVRKFLEMESDNDSDDGEGGDEDESESKRRITEYNVSIMEAIKYYKLALQNAYQLKKSGDVKDQVLSSTIVLLHTKLGDCNVLLNDFEAANNRYELVLCLLRDVNKASSTLKSNAHALSMLATCNLLLGNFGKASSIYECAAILQHHLDQPTTATFSHVFTLTLLGVSRSLSNQFNKAIGACSKAFHNFSQLYTQVITDYCQFWFIAHLLYILGDSYYRVGLYDKSLFYLNLNKRFLLGGECNLNDRQLLRCIKRMGDVYSEKGNEELAKSFYDEALSISDSSSLLGDDNELLLNSINDLHIDAKQYAQAAVYYEKARDQQRSMQDSMKIDYANVQIQLSSNYLLAGDYNKAMECLEEAIETFHDVERHKQPKQIMGKALLTMALINWNYEKACRFFNQSLFEWPTNVCRFFYALYLAKNEEFYEAIYQMPFADYDELIEIDNLSQVSLYPFINLNLNQSTIEFHLLSLSYLYTLIYYATLHLDNYAYDCLEKLIRNSCNCFSCRLCLAYAYFYTKFYQDSFNLFRNLLITNDSLLLLLPNNDNCFKSNAYAILYMNVIFYFFFQLFYTLQYSIDKNERQNANCNLQMTIQYNNVQKEYDNQNIDKNRINENCTESDETDQDDTEMFIEETTTIETPSIILELLKSNSVTVTY